MNILLTAIGGPSGICIAKSLREIPGVRLIGTNAEDDELGRSMVDEFYLLPFANDTGYLPALRAICVDENVDYILPLVDEEVVALSENAESFSAQVLVSPAATIRYTNDKGDAYETLEKFLPQRYAKSAIDSFPLFAKPRIGRGGKGAMKITEKEQLAPLSDETYVFQEFLEGPEITVDALFDLNGGLVVAVPRIRKKIDQGISVMGEVVEREDLLSMIREIADILTFVGPINFQFMNGANGFRLLEINARASGGMGITIHSGVDIPKLAYALMCGETLTNVPAPKLGTYANFDEVLERQRRKKEKMV